jgi:hypothetical protein
VVEWAAVGADVWCVAAGSMGQRHVTQRELAQGYYFTFLETGSSVADYMKKKLQDKITKKSNLLSRVL